MKKVYVIGDDFYEVGYTDRNEALLVFGKELLETMQGEIKDVAYWFEYVSMEFYQDFQGYFTRVQELLNNDQTEINIVVEDNLLHLWTFDEDERDCEIKTTTKDNLITKEELNVLIEKNFKEIRDKYVFRLPNKEIEGKLIQTEEGLKLVDNKTNICYNISVSK